MSNEHDRPAGADLAQGVAPSDLPSGSVLPYGALLLATEAVPRTLAIPAAERPKVHSLRTLADSRAVIAASRSARRAVVIGASFSRLEVAASLRTRGLDADVVAPEATPFERILGPALGSAGERIRVDHSVVAQRQGQTMATVPILYVGHAAALAMERDDEGALVRLIPPGR